MLDCAKCGTAVHPEVVGCPSCGADPRTGVVPESVLRMTALSRTRRHENVRLLDQTRPEGIGGWLVLPLIGLCLSPFLLAYSVWVNVVPFFASDVWNYVTTPATPYYSAYWAPYLIAAFAANVALIAYIVVTLVFFLQRRHFVPLLMTVLYLCNVLIALFDLVSAQYFDSLFPDLEVLGAGQGQTVLRAVVAAAVWIPYFWRSARVRATFVR